MGDAWYDDATGQASHGLYRREWDEAGEVWGLIKDVRVKKGVWWGQTADDVRYSSRTIPAREERRR